MPDKKNRITLTVAGLLALMGLVLGFFVSQHISLQKSVDISQFHGTLLDKPRAVSSFELMGSDHLPFSNANLQGHWTMMFFGFTNCGSICPTTMAELGKMYRIFEEKGVKTLPNVVMVTLDPSRDSLEKLNTYVKAFHPSFYGVRGDEDVIKAMTQEMGIAYALQEKKGSKGYDLEHTGAVILFNPQGELSAFFTMPHQAKLLAKDYLLLVS